MIVEQALEVQPKSYNQEKGLKNFTTTLKPGLDDLFKEAPERFAYLASFQEAYLEKVGVMPEFVVIQAGLKDDEGNVIQEEIKKEVIFAGKRLAESVLRVVTEINDLNMSFEQFDALVHENYKKFKKTHTLSTESVSPEYAALQASLAQEIRGKQDEWFFAEDALVFDTVDLIKNTPKEELDTEGLRSLGLIPKDFNTLLSSASKFLEDNPDYGADEDERPKGIIKHAEDSEEWEILCPNCYSTIHVGISSSEFLCVDCDTEFTCDVSMGDIYETEEDAEGMLNQFFKDV